MTDAAEPTPGRSLAGRVARGAAWIMGAGLVARLMGALNTIIVARFLVPEDFGVVATATIIMQLMQGVSDIGVSQAVVRFRDASRDDLNTLFTLSMLRGFIIGGVLFAAAPFAADFFRDPRFYYAFCGVALYPALLGLINPRYYEFEREMNFTREFAVTFLNRLAGVGVSIAVAVIFRTYWAIILGMLASAVVQVALSYAMRPHLPRLSFASLAKVFGFSGWLAGVSFLAALNNKLDVPVLTRAAGEAGAGVYFLGLQLCEMVTGQLAAPMTRALYPGLSEMQGEPDRMRQAFLRGVEALGALAAPAAFGLAFIAPQLTTVVLGEKWTAAAPIISILAPVIGLQSLFYASQAYAVALGLTRLVFFRELIFLLVRMPVFIWAAITHGLNGAVYAAAALGLFHVALNLALYARASGAPFYEPLVAGRRPLGAVAVMSVWLLAIAPAVGAFAPLAHLAVSVATGGGVYVAALFGLWRLEGRPDGVERQILALAGRSLSRIAAK